MGSPLYNPNFRRLFLGRLVTNAGDSIYYIAAMWLVFDLTGSELYTGIAGFLLTIPAALQFLAGPLVDRLSLRRILIATQLLQVGFVTVIAVLGTFDILTVWVLLAVMGLTTFLNQPVYPAQAAALPRILDSKQLVEANSFMSFAYQGVDTVFQAIAGFLIASIGVIALFWLDSLTFVIAILLFIRLKIPPAGKSEPGTRTDDSQLGETDQISADTYINEIIEGFSILRGTFILRLTLGSLAVNLGTGAIVAIFPAYAATLGGPEAYGILSGSLSAGLVIGALTGKLFENIPFGRLIVGTSLVAWVLWVFAIGVAWLPVTAFLVGLSAMPSGIQNVTFAALVQSSTPEEILGRVSSTISSLSTLMQPVGALFGGVLAYATSPTLAMLVAVSTFALFGFYVLASPSLRHLPRVEDVPPFSSGS